MNALLANFISINGEPGRYRFQCTVANEANTYRKLRQLGYRRTKEDNKIVYYKLGADEKSNLDFSDIRFAFRDFLLNTKFVDMPDGLDMRLVLNWFWERKNLVRENDLLKHYLQAEELDENDN